MICIELGCGRSAHPVLGYCVEHQAQFWPLWAAHPLDEPCPPGCPSRAAEIDHGFWCPPDEVTP